MILRKGMQSPDVLNLEQVLIGLGYKGFEADGFYDEKTENVIKNIQETNNLTVDGIAGAKTLAVIDAIYEPHKPNFENYLTTQQVQVVAQNPVTGNLPKLLSGVHPILARKALQMIELAKAEGYEIRVSQGLRTFAEQDKLFNQPRDKKDNDGDGKIDEADEKVTNARGGFSYHNYGIAVDFVFYVNGKVSWDEKLYKNLGRWASRVGLTWGGSWRFVDLPHCQLPNMTSIRALLECYQANGGGQKGIDAVWKKFVK